MGGGFLAQNVTTYLKKKHYEVDLINRKRCDLLELKKLPFLFEGIPTAITIIIPAAITRLVSNDKDSYDKNIQIIENFVRVMPSSVKHVIFFSTVDVYGLDPTLPINELNSVNPNDFYAKAKLDSEIILNKESGIKGFNLTILRLCGVYGKGDASKSAINRLVSCAINDGEISITSSPRIERDFISVNDVSRIIEKIITNKITGIFNVATGQSHAIASIAEKIVSILKLEIDINMQIKIVNDRVLRLQFDTSKLTKNFKDIKMTSLDDGLIDYISNKIKMEKC